MVRFSADDFVDTASYEEAINRLGYISIVLMMENRQ